MADEKSNVRQGEPIKYFSNQKQIWDMSVKDPYPMIDTKSLKLSYDVRPGYEAENIQDTIKYNIASPALLLNKKGIAYRPASRTDQQKACSDISKEKTKACKDENKFKICVPGDSILKRESLKNSISLCRNWREIENHAWCFNKQGVQFDNEEPNHRDQVRFNEALLSICSGNLLLPIDLKGAIEERYVSLLKHELESLGKILKIDEKDMACDKTFDSIGFKTLEIIDKKVLTPEANHILLRMNRIFILFGKPDLGVEPHLQKIRFRFVNLHQEAARVAEEKIRRHEEKVARLISEEELQKAEEDRVEETRIRIEAKEELLKAEEAKFEEYRKRIEEKEALVIAEEAKALERKQDQDEFNRRLLQSKQEKIAKKEQEERLEIEELKRRLVHLKPKQYGPAPYPYSQASYPYPNAPIPYSQAPYSPYLQAPIPYLQAPIPYSQAPIPYSQAPIPYSQAPIPYPQAQVQSQQDARKIIKHIINNMDDFKFMQFLPTILSTTKNASLYVEVALHRISEMLTKDISKYERAELESQKGRIEQFLGGKRRKQRSNRKNNNKRKSKKYIQ